MKAVARTCLVVALALGHLEIAAAQATRLRHMLSVYADDAGVGLNRPEGVACGPNGRLIVADTGNDRLVRFTYQDKAVTGATVMQSPRLVAPTRVGLNSKGDIYAIDGKARRLVHLGPDGTFREAVAFTGAPAPATIVAKSFTIDSADNLYVLDVFSARVLVAGSDGAVQRVLPFPGGAGFMTDVAVDDSGRILLLDSIKRQVFYAESDAKVFTALDGDLRGTLPTLPSAIAAIRNSIVVVETGGDLVNLRRDGSFLGRTLTPGRNEGSLTEPAQLCVNDRDELFVADRGNSRVQVFQLIR
jgi:sugar lactone lactonase YvrE